MGQQIFYYYRVELSTLELQQCDQRDGGQADGNKQYSSILITKSDLMSYSNNSVYVLYRIYKTENMQVKLTQANHYRSAKVLKKHTSMPSFKDTNYSPSTSSNSIDSLDDQYRKCAIRWILSYNKKVTRDTQYLAVCYLNRLNKKSIHLSEQNYEKVALTLLLLASKMNEIYPPKISSMMANCKHSYTQEEIIAFQGKILDVLGFQMAIDDTVYTHITRILGCLYADKLDECERLLRMVAPQRQIYYFGQKILAYAIIYLIVPEFIKKMRLPDNDKTKTLAIKIYNLYVAIKEKYDRQKENRQK